ncbi:replication initiator [Planosporangium mesophilum]|uniref:Plasmid replication initiator protein n=1 Tax=Planosporangium mesophilum TaxID=689768 RepID=A0A8J3X2C1_9ACTN|nr:replication initiator [Planosporangium mesophilum]NJC83677.1 plasmid replication initiator protein [Planosporangium mesophilum]GII25342.1 hypothetical protein Pme01_49390 [Planosporangium mesophilum]
MTSTDHTAAAGTPAVPGIVGLLADLAGLPADVHTGGADPYGLIARATSPDFGTWYGRAGRLRGCTHPVRLYGGSTTVDAATGRVLEVFDSTSLPDGVLYKSCGNRREQVCPACSRVYRYDTYHVIAAGLRGGKGVPEHVAEHPALFITLVAPSFGPVHTGPSHQHAARTRCRPRRDKPLCLHGKPAYCYASHAHTDRVLGRPLCLDCYDHAAQVVWNHFAPRLWDRTMTRLRALLRAEAKRLRVRVAVRYAKIAETQRRGVIHYHAVLRLDGYDKTDPEAILPPPAQLSAETFRRLVLAAAADVTYRTPPHPDRPAGWLLEWGAPTGEHRADVRIIRRGIPDAAVTEQHVAGYLAKYVTKSTEVTGLVTRRLTGDTVEHYADPDRHTGRLIDACWTLGRPTHTPTRLSDRPQPDRPAPGLRGRWSCPDCGRPTRLAACAYCNPSEPAPDAETPTASEGNPYAGLRRWAHQYGHGGHITTKSRRYSITMGELRAARQRHITAHASTGPADPDPADHTSTTATEHDQDATVVIGQWRYLGTGWKTIADAALALAAADAARSRTPVGLATA